MKKIALIFPGQGSQYIGMGKGFADQDPEALALLDLAGEIAASPIRGLCFEGPMEELTKVLHLQPALTAVNLICWRELQKRVPGLAPSFLAGHSLGEYSALHAAGVLSLEDTLRLVSRRGELMEREGALHPGGMCAVLGLQIDEVEALLRDFAGPGVAVVANHNTETQIVLSGDRQGLEALGAQCQAKGAKVIPLNISVANHSPLVAGSIPDFAAFLEPIAFHPPAVPVLFNVSADYEHAPTAIKTMMARQIASRVRWFEIIQRMLAGGVEVIIELGPKNVLTGMMRKILPKNTGIVCMQADTPEAMDKVAAALTGE